VKKRNIKLIIEYDGSKYFGWQSQNGRHVTVQETIGKTLKKIIGEKVVLYGASRTDSGVHAFGQVANFYSATKLAPERLRGGLNKHLPHDIVIRKVSDVSAKFNSKRNVKSKTYCYTMLNGSAPSAIYRNTTYFLNTTALDVKSMEKAARYLEGKHDFSAFTSSSPGYKKHSNVRTIYSLKVRLLNEVSKEVNVKDAYGSDCQLIQFLVRGNGFLYNMVRSIVGTLVMVGKNKIPPKSVKKILESADRNKAGQTMPPRGLCLLKVEY